MTHDPIVLAAATLKGDLRDVMLSAAAAMTKTWDKMTEAEQRAMAERVDALAGELVTKACVIVASQGRPGVIATLERVTMDSGGKAILTLPVMAAASLAPVCRQMVTVTAVGNAAMMGERGPAQVQPDEPPLPLAPVVPPVMPEARVEPEKTGTTAAAPKPPKPAKPKAPPKPQPPARKVGSPFARG